MCLKHYLVTKEKVEKKMKNRLREGATSVIGLLFLLASFTMVIKNIFYSEDFSIFTSILPVSLLGWVFLWAKNSLLEGITLGLFKNKES